MKKIHIVGLVAFSFLLGALLSVSAEKPAPRNLTLANWTPLNYCNCEQMNVTELTFRDEEDFSWAKMWFDSNNHEFYINVTDGGYMHGYSFDAHGSFIADHITSKGDVISHGNFNALNGGSAYEPAFRKLRSGIFFPDINAMAFGVNNGERMVLDAWGNLQVNGNLNVEGCIRHSCGSGNCITIGECL